MITVIPISVLFRVISICICIRIRVRVDSVLLVPICVRKRDVSVRRSLRVNVLIVRIRVMRLLIERSLHVFLVSVGKPILRLLKIVRMTGGIKPITAVWNLSISYRRRRKKLTQSAVIVELCMLQKGQMRLSQIK